MSGEKETADEKKVVSEGDRSDSPWPTQHEPWTPCEEDLQLIAEKSTLGAYAANWMRWAAAELPKQKKRADDATFELQTTSAVLRLKEGEIEALYRYGQLTRQRQLELLAIGAKVDLKFIKGAVIERIQIDKAGPSYLITYWAQDGRKAYWVRPDEITLTSDDLLLPPHMQARLTDNGDSS